MSHPTPTPTPSPSAGRDRGGYHDLLLALLRGGAGRARGLRVALGMVLIGGVLAAAVGTWAFAELAEAMREGATQRFDESVLRALDRLDAPWLEAAMLEITALGNGTVVIALATVAAAFLWLTRHRYSAALLVAATAGALALNVLLKSYFDRPRPQVVTWGTHVSTSSFPSGHATSAIVVYATVAYLLTRLQRRPLARALTLLAAGIVVLLIAASRLFLGVHYPSDVAAGLAIGLAWTAFCMAVLEALHRFIRRDAPEEAVFEAPMPADAGDAANDAADAAAMNAAMNAAIDAAMDADARPPAARPAPPRARWR
jgi:undecaprenyl-diphosphatase